MMRKVLERYMLGLLGNRLLDDGVRLFDETYISYLLDLRFNEKLVLLIVHYFIDHSNLTHPSTTLNISTNNSIKAHNLPLQT